MNMTSVFAPITKSVEQEDGSLLVYGKATDDSLDLDEQRCDADWLSQAMPEWYGGGRYGNIREQHDSKRAVGKAVDHETAPDGHYITAKIIDPVAVAKTRAGVFTGFSIGISRPKIVKSDDAPNGRITGGMITEISLVDRPANSNAILTLCKSAKPGMELNGADFDAERGLVRCEEIIEKAADETEAPVEDQVTKATDMAHLDAPAPGQTCEKCGEDGHYDCGPTEVDTAMDSSFDREAVKTLVAAVLAKADGSEMPPEYDAEQMDIENAQAAISLISKLIQSEAAEMVDNPAEDCDIQLLLSAVSALRCFIGREQEQAMGADVAASPSVLLAADSDIEKDASVEKATEPGEKTAEITTEVEKAADTVLEKAVVAATDATVEKTAEPEATKAATVEDSTSDGDALVKALEAALSKADSPLRKTFESIVESSTEATAESVKSLTERLAKVEQMAVPGGPSLRRTEVERTNARRTDHLLEAARYKALAQGAEDSDLRRGYATKAARLEAEAKTL